MLSFVWLTHFHRSRPMSGNERGLCGLVEYLSKNKKPLIFRNLIFSHYLTCYHRCVLSNVLCNNRQQNTSTCSHPNNILVCQQRRNPQACRFMLLNDVIAIGEHSVYSRRQVYFTDSFQATKINRYIKRTKIEIKTISLVNITA